MGKADHRTLTARHPKQIFSRKEAQNAQKENGDWDDFEQKETKRTKGREKANREIQENALTRIGAKGAVFAQSYGGHARI